MGTQATGTLWLYMSAQAGTKQVAYTSLHMWRSTRPRGTACSPSLLPSSSRGPPSVVADGAGGGSGISLWQFWQRGRTKCALHTLAPQSRQWWRPEM